MHLHATDIRARLPHRPPILLVRTFTVDRPGERGRAEVALDLDARLFGEQRARDLYQELVLEAAAQSLGLLFGDKATPTATAAAPADTPMPAAHLLLGFNDVSFLSAAPWETLTIEVGVVQQVGGMCRGRFRATAGTVAVAAGELTVMQGESDAA